MNSDRDPESSNLIHNEITGKILKCFFKVHTTLGFGFLESVYHEAMLMELSDNGVRVKSESPIGVFFRNKRIGSFYPDLIVEDVIIVELKATPKITASHQAQLLNYLKASRCEVGLLLNFGRSGEFKRLIFENEINDEMSFEEKMRQKLKRGDQ